MLFAMRGLEGQQPPTVMCVQSGTVSVHPQGQPRLVVLVWWEKATSVGMANGETESLSLFVTQSFLLCAAGYSGIIAALFVPHIGLLHPPPLYPPPLPGLTRCSRCVTGLHTEESDLPDKREFGVQSLAVFCCLSLACGGYTFWVGMGNSKKIARKEAKLFHK